MDLQQNQNTVESIISKSESDYFNNSVGKSIGKILHERRLESNIEISEISSYLKIKTSDISAIEDDDLNRITKHLYVPGLIRSYAKFLKIDQQVIEEKIRNLPIASNVENKKHQLLNIGENSKLAPDKDAVLNFLLISILSFLVLLSVYNSYEDRTSLITNQDLIKELEQVRS